MPIDTILKIIIVVGVAALTLIGVKKCQSDREALAAANSTIQTEKRTSVATTSIVEDIATGREEGQQAESVIRETHYVYQQAYQQARRDDPDVAAWGDAPVPQRMRDLGRERREQRERFGCTGDGCRRDGPEPGAND